MSRAVILTALSVEYLAVRAHLTNLREDTHPNGTIYERGSFSAGSLVWDVGIVEIGAGNTGAALEAERAIAYFSPNIVLFVGVAGGIKDVAIGDVVASTKIYGYESGKAEQRFKPRPDIGLPSYSLEQRAKAEARKEDWLQRLANFPNPTPRVFVAPIAAGEKVMASTQSDVFQFLSENYGDAIAIEMEGLGFLEAARANQHVSAMVIRGISDLIDGKGKSDRSGSQETASRHASAFAFEVLAKSKFQDALPPTIHPESSGIIQQNSANAQGWQVVVQGGTAYIGNIHIHEEPKDIELTGIPCNIIQRGTTTFVGRDVDLDTLHTQLQQDQKIAIFAIIGMGGIGKTELALQYALRHQGLSTYTSSVCWLKAREEIGTQIVLFARTRLGLDPPEDLGLAGKVAWCWQRWNKGNALILFDDVQDYSNIELFLPPPESRFKVLITTRSRLGSPVQNYEIKVLSERQSLELLRKIVLDERIDQQVDMAKRICEWLGYLPLGLELIGRYLARKQDISMIKLWERLQYRKLDAKALLEAEPGMTASLGVTAAFELSWQELQDKEKKLCCLLSIFALAPIPWHLVQRCYSVESQEDLEDMRDEKLLKLSLLYRTQYQTYELHQIIKEYFGSKLNNFDYSEELKKNLCAVITSLSSNLDNPLSSIQVEKMRPVIPHLIEAILELLDQFELENLNVPYSALSKFYESLGLYEQASQWQKTFISDCTVRLGEEHSDICSSSNYLAYLYNVQGNFVEAEKFYLRSLEMRQRTLGEDHISVGESLSSIGYFYNVVGRYSDSEYYHSKALKIIKRVFGEEHIKVAASLNSYAYLYAVWGKYSNAEDLYIQALELRRKFLGNFHFHTAQTIYSLADVYCAKKQYLKAEGMYLESLEIRENLLDKNHPDIFRNRSSLAYVYAIKGDLIKAEIFYSDAIDNLKELVGENHRVIAILMNNLSLIYELQEKHQKFDTLHKRALEIAESKLGKLHPNTILIRNRQSIIPGLQS